MNEFFNNLYLSNKQELLSKLKINLKNNKKAFIITSNPETFMYGLKNKNIKNILLNKDNYILADGIGIIKGCKKLKLPIPNKISGVDLMEDLLKITNENKATIFLYGSKENVLNDLKITINHEYKNVKIVGMFNGYDHNEEKIANEIVKTKPDFIFVALGVPNQELFIDKYYDKFKKGIFIGVGGSFDVLSGNKKRAPKIFRKLNIEWLYRIIREPKRIKRFYQNNIKFLFKLK